MAKEYYLDGEIVTVDEENEKEFLDEYGTRVKPKEENVKEYDLNGETVTVDSDNVESFEKEFSDAKPLAGKYNSSVASANAEQSTTARNRYDGSEYASDGILSEYQLNNSTKKFGKKYEAMPKITSDLTSKSEEDAIKDLQDKWMEYGFSFEQKRVGQNKIEVKALDGSTEVFDLKSMFSNEEDYAAEAERMDKWMRDRAEHQGDKLEGFLSHVNVRQDQKNNIPVHQSGSQDKINKLREAWGLEGYSDEAVMNEYKKWQDNHRKFVQYDMDEGYGPGASHWVDDMYKKQDQLLKAGFDKFGKDFEKDMDNISTIVDGRKSYKQQEALRKYKDMGYVNDLDGMFDEEGVITKKGIGILESQEYKNIYNSLKVDKEKEQEHVDEHFKDTQMNKYLEKNLKEQIEKFENNIFVKSDTQKELLKMSMDRHENMSKANKEKLNKFNVVYGDLENIYNESNKTADWLNSIGDGKKKMEEIEAKYDLTTNEGVKAAQAEWDDFQAEYKDKLERYDFLQSKKGQYEKFAHKIGAELDKANLDDADMKVVIDALGRNYQQGTVLAASLSNALIDLGQGAVNAGDWALSMPRQLIKEIDNPAVSAFFKVADGVNPNRNLDKANKWLDNWQKETITDRIENPTRYKDIDSLSSFGEWASTMVAGQVPILATMWATGGYSLYIMGATSTGSKWRELQDSTNEYNRTGGLYGQKHSWTSAFLNAGVTGAAESLSEKITLGQLTKFKGILKNSRAAKLGWEKGLRRNVFTWDNTKGALQDRFEEGFSESISQITGNAADIMSGIEGANIWDGVQESFVSGVLISQAMGTMPTLGNMMSAPFRSSDTNQRVGENSEKIKNLAKRQENLDHNSIEFKEIENEIVKLVNESNKLIEQDVKRVGLFNDNEKKALINIEKQNYQARKKAEDIMLDPNLTSKEKREQLRYLQEKVDMRARTKNDILNKHNVNVTDSNYENDMDHYRRQADMANKMGGPKFNVREVGRDEFIDVNAEDDGLKSKAAVDDIIMQKQGEIEGLLNILRDPDSSPETKQDASRLLKQARSQEKSMQSVLAQGNDYGVAIPKFDKKGNLTSMDIVINRDAALTDGKLNTGAHEFLHGLFAMTIKSDPDNRKTLGKHMNKIIQSGKMSFKNPAAKQEYEARIKAYNKDQRGEEQFTILSEMYRDGKVSINESMATKIGDFFRRWSKNYTQTDIEFNETQDILNFIKDFDYNVRKNINSPAMARMMAKGANGRIFENKKSDKTIDRERSFSRAVDLNRRQNPDLKREYDQFVNNSDGTRKYKDNAEFRDSPDFYGAFLNIVEGRALDGLVQHGMTERGLPPEALREFTRMAKEEIGRRFLNNFNYEKNDSLFGWLTGVSGGAGKSIIYRAKGDVMAQYKKENKAQQVSIDKPIGEGTKLSDVLQDERDVLIQEIDNQDLSINRRREAKAAVRDLKVKEILDFSSDTKQSIMDNIREANIPLSGYTFKGIKDLLVQVDKKATTEKKIVPTGPLFPVLNAVSTEFGVDPLRILAKQDLNANQREAAQSYILQKVTNEDGSFNKSLLDILPEGETRSGEATGIANTKLGQLYETGDRLKVSEGADKGLGQKKSQTKRNNVSRDEFLDMFGIEPNGRLRKGTKADGAIRALVVATAQMAANQDVRINALTNGTATEAEAAKLADGRSQRMFSKKVNPDNIDIYEDRWNEAIGGIGEVNMNDKKAIYDHVLSVYGDVLSPKEIRGITNDWFSWKNEFQQLNTTDNLSPVVDAYDLQSFIIDKTNESLLDSGLLATFRDRFVTDTRSISELFNDKDRVKKRRGDVVALGNELIDRGVKPEDVLKKMFLLKGMYSSAVRIGDKRFIIDKDGELVDNPEWTGFKINKKGERVKETNRGQIFENSQDFINTISKIKGLENIKGKKWNQIAKEMNVKLGPLIADTSDAAIKDQDYEGRLEQANEIREALEDLTKFYINGIYNGTLQYEDLAMLGKMLGSNMESPMKKAANLQYIAKGVSSVPVEKRGSALEYEHMKPTNKKIMEMFTSLLNNPDGLIDGFWDDYTTAVIPKVMDKVLIKSGLRDFMQLGYRPGMPVWKRYYNSQTFGKKGLVPIRDISTGEWIGEEFVKASEKFVNKEKQDVIQETNSQRMKSKKVPRVKGMSAFDFDETLIVDGKNVVEATNPRTGERETISSEDWPIRGTELMEQGWEFDFSDFINVKGGTKGPLFQKLKNRIQKFGSQNNFILTARPQASAAAIHGWLMANGVYLPPENITGLGDSSGDSKALWILDKFKEGYNDIYFVDDALPNVTAVKHVMDQLDIKGSSVQALAEVEGKTLMPEPVVSEFTKAAENARKQIKIIEEDLKKRGYKILGTTKSSEFRRVGGLKIDLTTKEGREISKQLDDIKTVKSSESDRMKSKFVKTDNAINEEFNDMLERDSGIKSDKIISEAEAKKSGVSKENLFQKFFVPPSAEDFKGLLYKFLGKGKRGDKDLKFFKKYLLDPFAKGIRNYNTYRQRMSNDYAQLQRDMSSVVKSLRNQIEGTSFTVEDAIRTYLWNKAGFEIPGMDPALTQQLVEYVDNDPDLVGFAEGLSRITKRTEGYVEPDANWSVTNIASDLNSITRDVGRKEFLDEWIRNKDIIFSKENLNKIQAIYGKPTREALENILYRMENGTNRTVGQNAVVNKFLNWINGSVGAVMFFNTRSALLQTISTVNFINWEDNNIFKAAAAFANQPQFWSDFAMIFNSDMLKQRRGGLQIDVNFNELTDAFQKGRSKPEAVIRYLLEKGFLPTKLADSFAIAMGGSTFFRNRVNTYLKEGASIQDAERQAWLDFQEIAEETQQSSRPDLISEQQAGVLGRLILAWQNTPMQMTRLTKKALSDLVNGRGSWKANVSRIMYYGLIQNIIFGTLQSGLAFIMFGDDEEEKKKKSQRVLNGALDTLLRGTGVWGAAVSTLKNTIMKFYEQREKGWTGDQTYTIIEAINLSPPLGSKFRKIYNAIQTDKFNRGVGEKLKYRIENPSLSIAGNVVEALTNFPMARLINKANNLEEAVTGNHELWQRIAMAGGWNRWSVGAEDEELEAAKQEVRDEKKQKKKIEKDKKKIEEKKQKEADKKKEENKKKEEGYKTVRCSGTNSSGKRCGMTTETKAKSWKCIHHMDFKDGMDRDGDGIKEYQCTATTSSGRRCRNKTENKNKKCYAHQ